MATIVGSSSGGTRAWSDSASWVGGVVPGAGDNVQLTATSGSITIAAAALCRSLDCTGYVGTLTHNAAFTLTIGDSTAGLSSVALLLVAGMTYTLGSATTSAIVFASTSATQQTVTTGGKVLGGVTFSGAGSSYLLSDTNSMGSLTHTNGVLGTGGQTCSWGSYVNTGTATRTLTIGASAIAITGTGTVWSVASATGMTLTANTATISISNTSSTAKTFAGAGLTYGTLSLAGGPGKVTITGANSFYDIHTVPETQLVLPASTTTTIRNTASTFGSGGTNYGFEYLHGVAGNYASTPDAAPLDITGDIDLRCLVAMDSWTPAGLSTFVSKDTATVTGRSYRLEINTTGTLQMELSADGNAQSIATSTVATGFIAGSLNWVRATWKQSTSTATFYTSPDGVTWTQLGTTVTLTLASIFVSITELEVGARTGGNISFVAGKFYRAQVYNGIAGTLVCDINFATKPFPSNSFTESSSNAATVTINGQAAQAGDGRVLIASSTPGTAATISCASGTVSVNNASIQDSTTTGGAFFTATNSLQVSNDTGWGATIPASVSIVASASGQPAMVVVTSASISMLANPPPASASASAAIGVVASASATPAIAASPSASLTVVTSAGGSPAITVALSAAISVIANPPPASGSVTAAVGIVASVSGLPALIITPAATVSVITNPPPASGSANAAVLVVANPPPASASASAAIGVVASPFSGSGTFAIGLAATITVRAFPFNGIIVLTRPGTVGVRWFSTTVGVEIL